MKHKRLAIRLEEKDHQKIKIEAAKRNMSITKFVLQAIILYGAEDKREKKLTSRQG